MIFDVNGIERLYEFDIFRNCYCIQGMMGHGIGVYLSMPKGLFCPNLYLIYAGLMNRLTVYSYLTRYCHGHDGTGRLSPELLPDNYQS